MMIPPYIPIEQVKLGAYGGLDLSSSFLGMWKFLLMNQNKSNKPTSRGQPAQTGKHIY